MRVTGDPETITHTAYYATDPDTYSAAERACLGARTAADHGWQVRSFVAVSPSEVVVVYERPYTGAPRSTYMPPTDDLWLP